MTTENRSVEAEIHHLIARRLRATRDKDAAGVIACQVPDAVHFTLAPPLRFVGASAEGLQAWFDSWAGPIGYDLVDPIIEADGGIAFAHGLARMRGTKQDGQTADLWFRVTFGFRRDGGAWKIVHEHQSTPFYMDGSFRAAVDLRP